MNYQLSISNTEGDLGSQRDRQTPAGMPAGLFPHNQIIYILNETVIKIN